MNITDVRENTRFILGDVQENNATFSDEELDSLRWTPCLGQGRGLIKREPCHPQGV